VGKLVGTMIMNNFITHTTKLIKKSPTFVGFFVYGMMGKLEYEKVLDRKEGL